MSRLEPRLADQIDQLQECTDHGHCIYCCTCEGCTRDRERINP